MWKLFKFLRANQVSLVYCLAMLLVPILSSSSIAFFAYEYESFIRELSFFERSVFYLLTSFTMAFAITPTTFISILSGYFWGWQSLLFVIVSYLGAAAIAFLFSKKVDNGNLLESLRKYEGVEKVIDNLKEKEFQVVFYAKISPLLPFAFSNFLLSAGGVSFNRFMAGSLIGMLPRTIFSLWIGTQAYQLVSLDGQGADVYTQTIITLLVVISAAGLFRLFRKAVLHTS